MISYMPSQELAALSALENLRLMAPHVDGSTNALFLSKANLQFFLKPKDVEGSLKSSQVDMLESQLDMEYLTISCLVMSNDKCGPCMRHTVELSGRNCSILLNNEPYVSSAEKFEGFSISLADRSGKESILKIKSIIGAENKESIFMRNRTKKILRSLFLQYLELFECGNCISLRDQMDLNKVLVKGSFVKLDASYTDYSEDLAQQNVLDLQAMVREMFPEEHMPEDLKESLQRSMENPIETIKALVDDCVFWKAERRRSVLIDWHSEFKTNVVKPMVQMKSQSSGKSKKKKKAKFSKKRKEDAITRINNHPYTENWMAIIKENEYLRKVFSWRKKNVADGNEDAENMTVESDEEILTPGEKTFDFMRNFDTHGPENAIKDGIFPFRLGWTDYILTAHFRRYMPFIQKIMKQEQEKLKKARTQGTEARIASPVDRSSAASQ